MPDCCLFRSLSLTAVMYYPLIEPQSLTLNRNEPCLWRSLDKLMDKVTLQRRARPLPCVLLLSHKILRFISICLNQFISHHLRHNCDISAHVTHLEYWKRNARVLLVFATRVRNTNLGVSNYLLFSTRLQTNLSFKLFERKECVLVQYKLHSNFNFLLCVYTGCI